MSIKKYLPLIKILVAIAAISLLLKMSEKEKLLEILKSIRWYWLVLPVIFLQIQTLISTLKWKLILKSTKSDVNYWFLAKAYFIGNFFSLFLPSSVGGDIYRTALLKTKLDSYKKSMASVIFERLTGLAALFFLALVGVLVGIDYEHKNWLVVLFCVGILVFYALLYAFSIMPKYVSSRFVNFVSELASSLMAYSCNVSLLIKAMIISLIFQSSIILINYLYCIILGLKVAVGDLIVIVPIVYTTEFLPISINGIGVRDSAFAVMFHFFGYPIEYALTLSLLIVCTRYIAALSVGGVLFLISKYR